MLSTSHNYVIVFVISTQKGIMKTFSKLVLAVSFAAVILLAGFVKPAGAVGGNIEPTESCDPAGGIYVKLNNTSKRFQYDTKDPNKIVTGACINVTRKNGREANGLITGNFNNVYGWSAFGVSSSVAGLQWVGGSDVISSMNYVVIYTQTL